MKDIHLPNIRINKSNYARKKVSFNIAKDIVSSKTVFTTHTPVPAGNEYISIKSCRNIF